MGQASTADNTDDQNDHLCLTVQEKVRSLQAKLRQDQELFHSKSSDASLLLASIYCASQPASYHDYSTKTWEDILSYYTMTQDGSDDSHWNTLINCLPICKWGQHLGTTLASQLLSATNPCLAWFVNVETTHSLSNIAAVKEAAEESKRLCTCACIVVQVLGYRPAEEILDVVRTMKNYNRQGSRLSLIVIAAVIEEETQKMEMERFQVYKFRSLRLNISYRTHHVPGEFEAVRYPFSSLFRRPECNYLYQSAEHIVVRQLKLLPRPTKERDRFSVATQTLGTCIRGNFRKSTFSVEEQLLSLAKAWASRHWTEDDSIPPSEICTLYNSGWFLPASMQGRMYPSPIADAISAFLDAFFYVHAESTASQRTIMLDRLLKPARSSRRLPKSYHRKAHEVTTWFTLMMAAYMAVRAISNDLINRVAMHDLSLALDLHAVQQKSNSYQGERSIIERMLEHGGEHGNGMRVMFQNSFDYRSDVRPPYNTDLRRRESGRSEAAEALTHIPDPDLLAVMLGSCAISDGVSLNDASLWAEVVPTNIREHLNVLGKSLRERSIVASDGARISIDVLRLDHLQSVFPNLHRILRPNHQVVGMPWLTAYILALGCGGRLSYEAELKEVFYNKKLQDVCLGSVEMPNMVREYEPQARFEWLQSSEMSMNDVTGHDFLGDPPRLFRRVVSKAYVYRPETRTVQKSWVGPTSRVTAQPNRLQLAACRVVFAK